MKPLWRWLVDTYGEGGKLHREIYYSDFGAWVRSMSPERRAGILSIIRSIAILAAILAGAILISTLFGCATPYQPPGQDLWRAL